MVTKTAGFTILIAVIQDWFGFTSPIAQMFRACWCWFS
jgi:hypothetical protein